MVREMLIKMQALSFSLSLFYAPLVSREYNNISLSPRVGSHLGKGFFRAKCDDFTGFAISLRFQWFFQEPCNLN